MKNIRDSTIQSAGSVEQKGLSLKAEAYHGRACFSILQETMHHWKKLKAGGGLFCFPRSLFRDVNPVSIYYSELTYV